MLGCRLTVSDERKSGLTQAFCWVRAWGVAVLRPYMSLLETQSFIADDVLEAALFIAEGFDGVEFCGAGRGVEAGDEADDYGEGDCACG